MGAVVERSAAFPNAMEGLRDYQEFHQWLDVQKGFGNELYMTLICLMEELGEVSQILKLVNTRETRLAREVPEAQQLVPQCRGEGPRDLALSEYRKELGMELADCLAYILKLANASGIDLESAYLEKMKQNMSRTWAAPIPGEVR